MERCASFVTSRTIGRYPFHQPFVGYDIDERMSTVRGNVRGNIMKSHTYGAAVVGALAGIALGVAGVGAARIAARSSR